MHLNNIERKERNEAIENLIVLLKTEYTEEQINFDKVRSIGLQYSSEEITRLINAMARFGPSTILNLTQQRKN